MSQQGKVEWMQGKVSQRKCPHEQFITDDCSGQQFTTDAYRYWMEGHASRGGEVEMWRLELVFAMSAIRRYLSSLDTAELHNGVTRIEGVLKQAALEVKHE